MVALLASLAALLPFAQPAVAPPSAPAPAAHLAATPRCATSGLVMWVNAEGSGTAGSFYFKLEFANFSGRTCTLAGYPGVSAVNLSGRQIGGPARREVVRKPRMVTLRPGAQAVAVVRVVDVGALPASCHPTAAAGFRVYPPGEIASKVVPLPFRTCANSRQSPISVRAITR